MSPTAADIDDEGRWIVIGGRRWRASDPEIPAPLRTELVAELMDDARRLVARQLATAGDLEVLQRGDRDIDPTAAWRGPVRLRPGPAAR